MRAGGVSRCAQREPRVWAGVALDLTDPPKPVAVMRESICKRAPRAAPQKFATRAPPLGLGGVFLGTLAHPLSLHSVSRGLARASSLARPLAADTRTLRVARRALLIPSASSSRSRHDGARAEEKVEIGREEKRRRRRLSAARLGRRVGGGHHDHHRRERRGRRGDDGRGRRRRRVRFGRRGSFRPRSFFYGAAASDDDAVLDPPPPAARSDAR